MSCIESNTIKSAKRRKYFDNYLSVGFIQDDDKSCVRPTCVLCTGVLWNSFLLLSKLKHHFETKHSEQKGKPLKFFPT
jgi:hypothetical protein